MGPAFLGNTVQSWSMWRNKKLFARGKTPPNNIGPRSTPNYPSLVSKSIVQKDGLSIFAGQRDDAEQFYADAWEAVTRTTLAHGGAISHHHGIGLHRGRFMDEALGGALDTLVALKRTLDPAGILNPGKLGLRSPFGEVAYP